MTGTIDLYHLAEEEEVHLSFHELKMDFWIWGMRSEEGILTILWLWRSDVAIFVRESAISLPAIPAWLGAHKKRMEYCLPSRLVIKERIRTKNTEDWNLNRMETVENRTAWESEIMRYLSGGRVWIINRTWIIACPFAEKEEEKLWRTSEKDIWKLGILCSRLSIIINFKT